MRVKINENLFRAAGLGFVRSSDGKLMRFIHPDRSDVLNARVTGALSDELEMFPERSSEARALVEAMGLNKP